MEQGAKLSCLWLDLTTHQLPAVPAPVPDPEVPPGSLLPTAMPLLTARYSAHLLWHSYRQVSLRIIDRQLNKPDPPS